MRNFLSIIVISVLLYSCNLQPGSDEITWGEWKVGQAGDSVTYKASVPGCIHTDLLNNGIIEDPFFGDNESKQQWIGETEWVYSTTFIPGEKDFLRKNI